MNKAIISDTSCLIALSKVGLLYILQEIYQEINKIKMSNRLKRITINPEICHGKPCIRGMRWPVEVIIDMLSSEMSIEQILEDHSELEKEDILASLDYAKMVLSGNSELV